MTKSTLRTVALETVANYRQVAEHAVGAYRASGHRLLAMMSRNLERGTRRIAPTLAQALQQTTTKVGAVAAKGIDNVSARTERAIEIGSAGVTAQIDRVADLAQGIENRYVATGLEAVSRFSLTGAQAALTVSEKLAAGADALAQAVGGKHLRGVKAVKRAKSAVKAARRATAPARPKVAKPAPAQAARKQAASAKQAARPAAKAKATRRAATKVERAAARA